MADLCLASGQTTLLFSRCLYLGCFSLTKIDQEESLSTPTLDNALVLSGKEGVDFHLFGRILVKTASYYSLYEAQLLQHLQFDLAFFWSGLVSIKGVVSYETRRPLLLQLAMQAARTKVLIAEP